MGYRHAPCHIAMGREGILATGFLIHKQRRGAILHIRHGGKSWDITPCEEWRNWRGHLLQQGLHRGATTCHTTFGGENFASSSSFSFLRKKCSCGLIHTETFGAKMEGREIVRYFCDSRNEPVIGDGGRDFRQLHSELVADLFLFRLLRN